MISNAEICDALPYPVMVEICCDRKVFRSVVRDSFKKVLEKHNQNYDIEVEGIARFYYDSDEYIEKLYECGDDEPDTFEPDEFRISIGHEVIHIGKCPYDISDDVEKRREYYMSIVSLTGEILDLWHDRIIEVQKENDERLKEFEAEGFDEMLYAYYNSRQDERAFIYLKKLGTRYGNGEYYERLRRVYRTGLHGWHKINPALACKMRKKALRKSF